MAHIAYATNNIPFFQIKTRSMATIAYATINIPFFKNTIILRGGTGCLSKGIVYIACQKINILFLIS